jgi:hypothetical protein
MRHRPDELVAFLPWFLLVFFPVLWVSVLAAISFVSGWSMLARRFATTLDAPAGARRFLSGSLGSVRFNNVLTVAVSADGLYLAVLGLFRPFHPPLLLPWASLRENPSGRSWLRTYESVTIEAHTRDVELRLFGGVLSGFRQSGRASPH